MKMLCMSLTQFPGKKGMNRMWDNNMAKNFSKVMKNLYPQIEKTQQILNVIRNVHLATMP